MRATTILRQLLGFASTKVIGFAFGQDGLYIEVKPTWRFPRCSKCKRTAKDIGVLTETREWRHLPWGGTRITLVADVRRSRCRSCGDVVEYLPWCAEPRDKFTYPMCDLIGHLAQNMPIAKVSKLLGVPWETVKDVAGRVAERLLPDDRLDQLTRIGVDEFHWADGQYLTVVWDHVRSRVVWVAEGKSEASLRTFFTQLGLERCERIEIVTGDMAASYLNAVRNAVPQADYVLDPFHVLKLAHDAIDEVRREIVRDLRSQKDLEEAKAVKGSRYTLFTHPDNLSPAGIEKIEDIRHTCKQLYRAWAMKESLAWVLSRLSVGAASKELKRVIKWMKLSRLRPFIRLGHTLREHLELILNSVRYQISNGPIEGCNRKIRGLIYRAYGYRSRDNFVGAIFLNCGGISVPNPLAR